MKILHDLKDASYQESFLSDSHLVIQYSHGKILLATFYPEDKKILSFKEILLEKNLKDINSLDVKRNIEECNQNFKNRLEVFPSIKHTLVPKSIFDENLKKDYLRLNFEIGNQEEIRKDLIESVRAINLYAYGSDISKINLIFRPDQLVHSSSTLLKAFYSLISPAQKNNILIHIEKSFIHVAYFVFDRFTLLNSYQVNNHEDVLYHILNLSREFGIDPDKDTYFVFRADFRR